MTQMTRSPPIAGCIQPRLRTSQRSHQQSVSVQYTGLHGHFTRLGSEFDRATGARRGMNHTCPLLPAPALVLFVLVGVPPPGLAQGRAPDLGQTSIEDLLNDHDHASGRKEQPPSRQPAAVFVSRRTTSGARASGRCGAAPAGAGVQVAADQLEQLGGVDRGFNNLFSTSCLVLIDGRSVYKRNFSGVFWDAEDLVLDDINRIESICGPGGDVWGANAVNGVINIVMKAAGDTQGVVVRVGGGTLDPYRRPCVTGDRSAVRRIASTRSGATRRYASDKRNGGRRQVEQSHDRRAPRVDAWPGPVDGGWSVRSGDGHPLWRFIEDRRPARHRWPTSLLVSQRQRRRPVDAPRRQRVRAAGAVGSRDSRRATSVTTT